MLRFADYCNSPSTDALVEALDVTQRLRRKQLFVRKKARVQLGRKIQSRRLADRPRLARRARRLAKNLLIRKLYQGRTKQDIPLAQRAAVEARLKRMNRSVNRLAMKLIRRVRINDINKLHRTAATRIKPVNPSVI